MKKQQQKRRLLKEFSRFMIGVALIGSIAGAQEASAGKLRAGYFKKLDSHSYLLNLLPGAKLVESLKEFQKATGVLSASVTGVGVLKNTQLGQYRFLGEPLIDGGVATSPKFPNHDDVILNGHREIVSLMCNLTTNLVKDKVITKSDPHCHVALAGSDDPANDSQNGYPVVGGHLVEGEVAVISELFITTYPSVVNKKDGGNLGGTIIDIEKEEGGTPLDYVLFVSVKVKGDKVEDFKRALLSIVNDTRSEKGNLAYIVHQSVEDPSEFAVYEHWATDEDHLNHIHSKFFGEYSKKVAPMMVKGYPSRQKYVELGQPQD